jgi:hypothetical protein
MAALASCAVTAALLKDRTDTQAPLPATPGQAPPQDPRDDPADRTGDQTPVSRSLPAPEPPGHATHWLNWRRRHQARSCWVHQRTRLNRDIALVN